MEIPSLNSLWVKKMDGIYFPSYITIFESIFFFTQMACVSKKKVLDKREQVSIFNQSIWGNFKGDFKDVKYVEGNLKGDFSWGISQWKWK